MFLRFVSCARCVIYVFASSLLVVGWGELVGAEDLRRLEGDGWGGGGDESFGLELFAVNFELLCLDDSKLMCYRYMVFANTLFELFTDQCYGGWGGGIFKLLETSLLHSSRFTCGLDSSSNCFQTWFRLFWSSFPEFSGENWERYNWGRISELVVGNVLIVFRYTVIIHIDYLNS